MRTATRLVLATAVAAASFAAPASAQPIRPCDPGEIDCYLTCYTPYVYKDQTGYHVGWRYC